MPRSTKATSRASTTAKRTSKRNTSAQRDVYAILESPESPKSSAASEVQEASRIAREDAPVSGRTSLSAPSDRGRSTSVSSTKVGDDLDSTPTQPRKPHSRAMSSDSRQISHPGLEALEAVNGLYQKLKESQSEVVQLREENARMAEEIQSCQIAVRDLRNESDAEKEKAKKYQSKDSMDARRSEDKLNAILASLRNFSSAAYDLMPLLDVLSDAPDIQYDEDTDKLFQVMKQYRTGSGDCKDSNSKHHASHRPD